MGRNGRTGLSLGMGMAAVVAAAAVGDSPPRPILVTSSSSGDLLESDDCAINSEPTSPTKLKKKVVFADDKGLQLEHVRTSFGALFLIGYPHCKLGGVPSGVAG